MLTGSRSSSSSSSSSSNCGKKARIAIASPMATLEEAENGQGIIKKVVTLISCQINVMISNIIIVVASGYLAGGCEKIDAREWFLTGRLATLDVKSDLANGCTRSRLLCRYGEIS